MMTGMKHEKSITQQLGETIRKLRTAAKMSQKELADKASALLPGDQRIYDTDLSKFENRGETITSINKIEALLSVFDQKIVTSEKKTLSISER